MQNLMIFEGNEVEVFEFKGQILFNANHIAEVLEIKNVRDNIRNMNNKQVVRLNNSTVGNTDIRKLHNNGENFLTESGVYKLVFKSRKPEAEKFTDWIADEVLPSIRKTGSYETPKSKASAERLASINNAVKILTPMLEKAGCNSKIQLLTAKSLYEKAGVNIPIEIGADKQYFDTVHIARKVGIYYKSSGKPADKAINEIIRRVGLDKDEYTETWESKGKWQGTVRKYAESVVDKISYWLLENGNPISIQFEQIDGQRKNYHVIYKNREVA